MIQLKSILKVINSIKTQPAGHRQLWRSPGRMHQRPRRSVIGISRRSSRLCRQKG